MANARRSVWMSVPGGRASSSDGRLTAASRPDAARPGRHYLVSERSRRLLRSVSEQGGWSQNTIVRLALMWLKSQLGPLPEAGAWA